MTLDQILRETEASFNATSSGCVVVYVGLVPRHRRPDFFHLKDYVVSSVGSEQYFMVPRRPVTLAEATPGPNTLGEVADRPISEVRDTNWRL